MKLRICVFLCSVHLLVLNVSCSIAAEKSQTKVKVPPKKVVSSTTPHSTTNKEDIYIDDDPRIEGSGISDVKDDLESSGSGFGPDDEDGDGGPRIDKGQKVNLDVDEGVTPGAPPKTSDSESTDTDSKTRDPDSELTAIEVDQGNSFNVDAKVPEHSSPPGGSSGGGSGVATNNQDVFVVGNGDDRATSFFAQPGILAAVIGGAVVGLLCAILVVMFIVYRMRKKDEGSYALEEPKRSPASNSYMKNSNREFYA